MSTDCAASLLMGTPNVPKASADKAAASQPQLSPHELLNMVNVEKTEAETSVLEDRDDGDVVKKLGKLFCNIMRGKSVRTPDEFLTPTHGGLHFLFMYLNGYTRLSNDTISALIQIQRIPRTRIAVTHAKR